MRRSILAYSVLTRGYMALNGNLADEYLKAAVVYERYHVPDLTIMDVVH